MKRVKLRESRISTRLLIALAAVGITAGTACADWHQFWHNVKVDFHRNNAWPDPFNEVDAEEVIRPFEIMTRNGWRMHNTIGHELFREGDGALLASGSNRIHWIATQAPQSRRAVFVVRGRTTAETDARVASVQQTLGNMNLNGPIPSVVVTDVEPATASGAWANKVSREWLSSLPKPQLPKTSVSGQQSVSTPSGN